MNVNYLITKVVLVSILINCIFCRENVKIRAPLDNIDDEISERKNTRKEDEKDILSTARDLSSARTIIPSFRVILLEVSFMAISIYLVNSLENYIQQKSKSVKPKNSRIEEDFFENFKRIMQNFKIE